jgi:hypothetical protein
MRETVLNNYDAQLAVGKQLREDKAATEANNNEPPLKGGGSFRERVMAARQAMDLKERAKKKIEEKITAPMKAGANWLLRWAWEALIPSLGMSLIYIHFHILLRQVFGENFFCKLGEEWLPKQVSTASKEAGDLANKSIGIAEIIVVLILDLLAATVIFLGLAIIYFLIDIYLHPIDALWTYGLKSVYNVIKALF